MPGKILSFILSICLSFSFVVFFFRPVDVHADFSIGDYLTLVDYADFYHDRMDSVSLDIVQNSDSTNVHFEILGLQQTFFNTFDSFTLGSGLEYSSYPDTISFGSSGINGLYIYDGVTHVCTFNPNLPISLSSDQFSITFGGSIDGSFYPTTIYNFTSTDVTSFYRLFGPVRIDSASSFKISAFDSSGFFTTPLVVSTYSANNGSNGYFKIGISSNVPTLTNLNLGSYIFASTSISSGYSGRSLFSPRGTYTLPSGNVSSSTPWDYYNETLLPYLYNTYGDEYTDYYIFPDGYTPSVPDPPVYPTDFVTGIPKDWTIENPPLPTAPSIDFGQGDFDFSKPSEYLEEVVNEAEALDFWWWLSEKTFKRCGVFEYFLAFITLGFAMYALWRWGS